MRLAVFCAHIMLKSNSLIAFAFQISFVLGLNLLCKGVGIYKMGQQLPKRIKTVWRLQAGFNLLIDIGIVVGIIVCHYFFSWPTWLIWVASLLAMMAAIIQFTLIPYRYQFWRYQLSDHDVEITTGFFVRKTTAVPILRIQDVTLSAGPLLQFNHLQSVKIHTAAAVHEIGGVDHATATKLKNQIMNLAKEEDVYDS